MGSGVSVIPPGVDDDIRELIETIDRQKSRIRMADAALLESEAGKMFKNHNKIIDDFTSRSKVQLRALFAELPNSLAQIELLASAGNHYASFLSKLHKTKFQIELNSLLEIDYDEELIIGILCTSTSQEIKHLDQAFAAVKNFSLRDLLESKIKAGTSLMKFIDRIFQFRRDESKNIDQELAVRQAEMIHQASSAKLLGVEEDTIFNVLSTASRAQCTVINQIYLEKYKMKLDRALNMKFKGLQAKLMTLWAMPIPMAIACWCDHLLHKMIIDREKLASFFARFEKDTLTLANNACKELHGGKGLVDNLKAGGVSGTLLQAFRGWIENPSPDKGFERILELFLQGKLQKQEIRGVSAPNSPSQKGQQTSFSAQSSPGKCHPEYVGLDSKSIEELVRLMREAEDKNTEGSEFGKELRLKVKFLLEKQAHELKLYLIDHQLPLSEQMSPSNTPGMNNNNSFSSRMGFSWRSARVGGTSSASESPVNSGLPTSPTQQSSPPKRFSFSETAVSPTNSNNRNNSTNNINNSDSVPTPFLEASPGMAKRRRHSQSLPSYDEKQEQNLVRTNNDGDGNNEHEENNNNDKNLLNKSYDSNIKQTPVPGIGGLIRQNSLFAQLKHVQEREQMDAHKHVDLVYDYLLPRFEAKDCDGEGFLEVQDFWQVVGKLPLSAFGLNAKAVDKIRMAQQSWVTHEETENEEHDQAKREIVYYYEALLELAETLVGAILSRVDEGEKNVTQVISSLKNKSYKIKKIKDTNIDTKEDKKDDGENDFDGNEEEVDEELLKSPAKNRLTMFKAASFRRTLSSVNEKDPTLTQDMRLKRQPSDIKSMPHLLQRNMSTKGPIQEETKNDATDDKHVEETDGTLYEDFIPPYFLQYVLDTIMAFDLDMNNTLSVHELEMLVAAMQIPSLTVDTFFLQAPKQISKSEKTKHEILTPREALRVIVRKIGHWFSPEVRSTGEDHYLCLVDIQSGAYFWYNARDESSVWAEVPETETVDVSSTIANNNEYSTTNNGEKHDGISNNSTEEIKNEMAIPDAKAKETPEKKEEYLQEDITQYNKNKDKEFDSNDRNESDRNSSRKKKTDTDDASNAVQRRIQSSPRLLSIDTNNDENIDDNDEDNLLGSAKYRSTARKNSKLTVTKSTTALLEGKEEK